MGTEYVELPTPFSHEFAPQLVELGLELEADEVVADDDESSEPEPPPPGGVRSTMRLGTAISITLSIIPTAAAAIRGPSLTIFTASWCSMLTILAKVARP